MLLWLMRIGLVACCTVAPWFAGRWCVVVVLAALPVLRAVLDTMRERLTARACVVGACTCAALMLPHWTLPVIILWGAGLLAMSVLETSTGRWLMQAGMRHGLVVIAVAVGLAAWRAEGQLIPVLARKLVDWVDRSAYSEIILIRAYQMGLARLKGVMALMPAIRIFQAILIPAAVRVELLNSLRLSMELLLQAYLPRWLMGWLILSSVLPMLAAEGYLLTRRQRSLPALNRWYIPESLVAPIFVLILMGLVPLLTDQPVLCTMGEMASTLGYWLCAMQGASLLLDVMDTRNLSRPLMTAAVVLAIAILPLVLFFMGGYDQLCDPRQLRTPRHDID